MFQREKKCKKKRKTQIKMSKLNYDIHPLAPRVDNSLRLTEYVRIL